MFRASRAFVNVRLNPWFDETNHEREKSLLGYFGHKGNTQNTVFCLFEPDAPGMSADSFPTEQSVYFGTRPGKRYSFVHELPRSQLVAMVERRRAEETGGQPVEPSVIDRIVWEYEVARDGEGLAEVMNGLAAKHPLKPGAADEPPRLPVMPDLTQALNIAAADSRGVIVVVHPDRGADAESGAERRVPEFERRLSPLVFEPGLAGRAHVARLDASAWAAAKASGQIAGGTLATGVFFVAPDPFGLRGDVWSEILYDAGTTRLRTELLAALDRFHREWRKLDRMSHRNEGSEQCITWSEYDPELGRVAPLPIVKPTD